MHFEKTLLHKLCKGTTQCDVVRKHLLCRNDSRDYSTVSPLLERIHPTSEYLLSPSHFRACKQRMYLNIYIF